MPSRAPAGPHRSPRTPLTTRAALLAVVVSALILLLALPLRTYLSQHAEIARVEAAQAAQQHRVQLLQQQNARAEQPAVVEEQARLRLQLTLPGERTYVVVTPSASPTPAPPGDRPTAVLPSTPTRTWFDALWGSALTAGEPGASPSP